MAEQQTCLFVDHMCRRLIWCQAQESAVSQNLLHGQKLRAADDTLTSQGGFRHSVLFEVRVESQPSVTGDLKRVVKVSRKRCL